VVICRDVQYVRMDTRFRTLTLTLPFHSFTYIKLHTLNFIARFRGTMHCMQLHTLAKMLGPKSSKQAGNIHPNPTAPKCTTFVCAPTTSTCSTRNIPSLAHSGVVIYMHFPQEQSKKHHAVKALLNSRPISMRRISEVPAPISYSFASRNRRPVG
jgi:hypothetical protein